MFAQTQAKISRNREENLFIALSRILSQQLSRNTSSERHRNKLLNDIQKIFNEFGIRSLPIGRQLLPNQQSSFYRTLEACTGKYGEERHYTVPSLFQALIDILGKRYNYPKADNGHDAHILLEIVFGNIYKYLNPEEREDLHRVVNKKFVAKDPNWTSAMQTLSEQKKRVDDEQNKALAKTQAQARRNDLSNNIDIGATLFSHLNSIIEIEIERLKKSMQPGSGYKQELLESAYQAAKRLSAIQNQEDGSLEAMRTLKRLICETQEPIDGKDKPTDEAKKALNTLKNAYLNTTNRNGAEKYSLATILAAPRRGLFGKLDTQNLSLPGDGAPISRSAYDKITAFDPPALIFKK